MPGNRNTRPAAVLQCPTMLPTAPHRGRGTSRRPAALVMCSAAAAGRGRQMWPSPAERTGPGVRRTPQTPRMHPDPTGADARRTADPR
jgi:hypothetical protein